MKNDISFFLGTNSGTGFHSLFYDLTEHATFLHQSPGLQSSARSGGR